MIRSVVIFCSSSVKTSPIYFSEMDVLARELARLKIRIVYGGAKIGPMGRLADRALEQGGEVVGVIPKYMMDPATVHNSLTELIVVDNLLDRKRKMLSLADAVVASPGGLGTLDEITEILALKQVGEHEKPIFFHNFLDFWRPLFDYFDELYERAMLHQEPSTMYTVCDSAQELGQNLQAFPAKEPV